jgi:hypothetical protein
MNSKQKNEKNAERSERKQHKIDAGSLSARYPYISSIVITMDYAQKSVDRVLMKRTVNFFPESSAYFLMECMKNDCTNGGFNLEPVITTMVKGRLKSRDGELACHGDNAPGHTRIGYNVAIQYNDTAE